ncbi:hypothetical protein GGS21DRAFT_545845 [Xylaria nigripes]|nr:hypothetical protein GGS21DRAFT_545845 [Xylaria nigripes]
MAPVSEEPPHYSGASPLDGGSSPTSLGGSGTETKYKPSALEIGLIVGVVSLVLISLVWLFFWRARRNQANRPTQTSPVAPTLEGNETGLTDASGQPIPVPLAKDDRASTAENDETSSIERPPRSHRRPMMNWNHWPQPSSQENRVEEHELSTRDLWTISTEPAITSIHDHSTKTRIHLYCNIEEWPSNLGFGDFEEIDNIATVLAAAVYLILMDLMSYYGGMDIIVVEGPDIA